MPEIKPRLKVFLCHSSQDKPIVFELYKRLLAEDWIDPWLDKEKLKPGQDFDSEIEKAIESADAVVAFISKGAVGKTGYIQKELKLIYNAAMFKPEGRLFAIPLRLEECDPPYGLKLWHWADYFGSEKEKTYSLLLESLKIIYDQVKDELQERQKEASEKVRLEVEEQARQKAAKEKAKREAAVKLAREKIDKEYQLKREKIIKDAKRQKFLIDLRYKLTSIRLYIFPVALGVSAIALLIFVLYYMPKNTPTISSTPTSSPTSTETIASVEVSTPSSTPTKNVTPTATPLSIEIADAKGAIMRLVPAGEFTMGSDNRDSDEQPIHQVYLDDYYIDIYEVTNAAYSVCVNSEKCNPPIWSKSYTRPFYYGSAEFDDYPVIYVNWNMAKNYCEWRDGRLPTEAEWEKAARGFTETSTFLGGYNKANYEEDDTVKVGSYEKNSYGLYDMGGNVREWLMDWYSANYYQALPSSNPLGPEEGTRRVLRGGSWYGSIIKGGAGQYVGAFATERDSSNPSEVYNYVGFRCVHSIP